MQHLLPLYLILAILPGIAALTVLSLLALRIKNKSLIYYLISYSCFTISILVNLVMFYQGINISVQISTGIYALIALNLPVSILMHTTLPMAVNELTQVPGKYWINVSIISLGAAELILYWSPLIMRYSRERHIIALGPVYPFIGILQMVLIIYSLLMIIFRRRKISDPVIRRYILIMTGIIAVFIPAIAYDQFYFSGLKAITTVPVTVILSPIFYAVLSLATIFLGIRVLISLSTQGNLKESQELIIRNLAGRSGLSGREITIIQLIARGLGNKQIALELRISPKTVGNHIYNIYRKLNITSRYELLALMK